MANQPLTTAIPNPSILSRIIGRIIASKRGWVASVRLKSAMILAALSSACRSITAPLRMRLSLNITLPGRDSFRHQSK